MEYREKKFKGAGENGKKSWKKENAGRNGNNGRNVNGKTERNSGRKETQNFVSGTEKRNGRNYGNQDKSVEKKLGYIDEKLEKKYGGAWNPTGEKNVNAGDKKKAASAAKRQDDRQNSTCSRKKCICPGRSKNRAEKIPLSTFQDLWRLSVSGYAI